jgi:CheY-like chemotaxis protein
MLDQVFDLFAQVDSQQRHVQSGLGIGLTLVKSLVTAHGGNIEAHSDGLNTGSTFRVRLPILADAALAPASSNNDSGKALHPSGGCHRVLVVDDNTAVLDMFSAMIKALGHEVRTASDGHAAIDLAAEFGPEIILMDLGMPGMDGYETARSIRVQPWGKDIVLAAVTGWNQDRHRQLARQAGFDHHLVKPVELAKVKELLAELDRNPV